MKGSFELDFWRVGDFGGQKGFKYGDRGSGRASIGDINFGFDPLTSYLYLANMPPVVLPNCE